MTSAKAWVAAIWGGVTGILSGLTVALVGDATLQTLSQAQWLAVIVLGVAGFGGGFGLTWSVTNKPGAVTEAQAAAVLDKYTAPVAVTQAPVGAIDLSQPAESGGQGNGDIPSS